MKGAVTASRPLLSPLPLHGLGRLGQIACHFLQAAAALIENLGGLAYLFSWNAAGYIFMAFSQQCSGSVSNYSKKKSQSRVSCRRRRQARPQARPLVRLLLLAGGDACCSLRLQSPRSGPHGFCLGLGDRLVALPNASQRRSCHHLTALHKTYRP